MEGGFDLRIKLNIQLKTIEQLDTEKYNKTIQQATCTNNPEIKRKTDNNYHFLRF